MRLLSAVVVFILVTGCMHSGLPASSVTDEWAVSNCGSVRTAPKNSCSEFRNCSVITSSSIGMCRCEYSDGSVYRGIISEGEPWCGVQQDGSDTLVFRNGSATAEKAGVDWASTAVLVAGIAVAAAVIDDDDDGSSNRSQHQTTDRRSESSTELGERLLREQRERGVGGTGRVATSSPSTYRETQPSVSREPSVGNNLYTIQTSTAEVCYYLSGSNRVSISKPAYATCPVTVNAPAQNSSAIFDYSQMQKFNVTGYKKGEARRYCTYATSDGDIFIPKGEYASCPQSIDF